MARKNQHVTYPRESSLNPVQVALITISIFVIGFLVYYTLFTIEVQFQSVRIFQSGLNHTIPELSVIAQDRGTNFPDGISSAVQKNSKYAIKYGTILLGECNSYFSDEATRNTYKKAHPNDIIWVESLGEANLRIWVFLEKGTSLDQKFFKLIK